MRLVVGSLMLIQILRDDDQPLSSSDDQVPNVAPLHDSPPSHGLGVRSQSSDLSLHASPDAAFDDLLMLLFLPTPPPSPLVSPIDLPPPPPPPPSSSLSSIVVSLIFLHD